MESIAQGFRGDPVDFVPQDGMQVLRRALDLHGENSGVAIGRGLMVCQLFTEGFHGPRHVVCDLG